MKKEKPKIVRRLNSGNYGVNWLKFKVGEKICVFKKNDKKIFAYFIPTELGWFYALKFVDMIENI